MRRISANIVHAEAVPFVRDFFNFWLEPVRQPPNLFVHLKKGFIYDYQLSDNWQLTVNKYHSG